MITGAFFFSLMSVFASFQGEPLAEAETELTRAESEDDAIAEETPEENPPATPEEIYGEGIRWTFGKREQLALRLMTWHQVWNRYSQLNPGTLIKGQEKEHFWDIGIRRARMMFIFDLTDRFRMMTHFGMDNQSFVTPARPQLHLLEGYAQFRIWKEILYVGAGLHYWNGVSRMSSASSLTLLSLDAPGVNFPTINRTDQTGRHLGVFAKGTIGPVAYRLAVNQPFVADEDATPQVGVASYSPQADSYNLASYVMVQFFDKESMGTSTLAGTYLGTKKILNLGVGVKYEPDGTWEATEDGEIVEHDIILVGADVFLDMPFKRKRGAVTFYGVYYYYDFGPNYLRNISTMEPGTTDPASTTPGGIAYPAIGTGHHAYGVFGYLLPWSQMKLQRLQPYAAVQVSFFEALDEVAVIPEAGINWHLLGHHAKLTLMYKNRPVFAGETEETRGVIARRSQAILQAMLYF